jgi:hypothetical protein
MQLRDLQPLLGEKASPSFDRMRSEVQAYWDSLELIFHWTPEEKKKLGPAFLLHDVLPRWSAVVSLAEEINQLNEADLRKGQRRLEQSQESFQRFLRILLTGAMALGIAVAVSAGNHFMVLLRKSDEHQKQVEHAEQGASPAFTTSGAGTVYCRGGLSSITANIVLGSRYPNLYRP